LQKLSDSEVYEELQGNIESPLINTIKRYFLSVRGRGDISSQTLDYFMVNNPRLGRFYLLPKIHKRLFDVPGRPVISNCGYYTENISAFVDHHLQPLAKCVKSYIKDTNHFLQKLRDLPPLPNGAILCTIDVVGLYPNIPHDEGLEAIGKALDQRETKTISTESIVELAECVLKNNYFEHNGRFFRQKRGTAIGTKMAPPYSILFLGELEEKLLNSVDLKPFLWWRYIDDIFTIWEHGEENLLKFIAHLNSFHPTIKFTCDYSLTSVNFLDVEVIKVRNKLVTDLYVKPTDTHQYLEASSCHVFHSKRSIPYSQALRLNRICSETSFFDKRCNELEKWLMDRGYNDKLVRSQVIKARKFKRKDLLNKEHKGSRDPKLVLNVTYHPAYAHLKSLLRNIHILLTPDAEHRKVFTDVPLIGFKRGKSLKDLLVRAKLPVKREPGKSEGCQSKRCGVCPFIANTTTFSDSNASKEYSIASNLNCNSKNVVYLVQCKTCNKQYVGSASTKFRLRFNNYKSCFGKFSSGKTAPQMLFHSHFGQPNHNGMEDWEFTLIDQSQDLASLRKREYFWQNKLQTFLPLGLNEKEVAFVYG